MTEALILLGVTVMIIPVVAVCVVASGIHHTKFQRWLAFEAALRPALIRLVGTIRKAGWTANDVAKGFQAFGEALRRIK